MKIVIFIILSILYLSSTAYGAIGEIEKVDGTVLYRENKATTYKKAKAGLTINADYWIKTEPKSWTVIKLIDGSKFTLSDNTELEISEYLLEKGKKNGVFYVTQGKLRATVVKLTGQATNYKVKTPTAVAGIKGTEFLMLSKGLANVFFGNENSVYIAGDDTEEKILVPDTMIQNTRGLKPTEPVKVESGTLLDDAKKALSMLTAATPPKEWEISGALPDIIARWNINYGHYLADAGRYEEALYVFQIALDLSDKPEIRADARLERGTVYSRFLRNSEAALAEYLLILEEYPDIPQREIALYLTGMTLYELGLKTQAKERLYQYKKIYPEGKYITNVETILKLLENEN
ncbi:MAG: FecR domain-containing protein [Thermodesulfovibrio sp.]|nr:FecR domain-containing protein [Thermodesulfovibrio sp.]